MGQVTPLLWSWFGQYVTLRVPLATHASLDANIDCDDHDDNTDGDDHDGNIDGDDHDDKRILYDDRLTIRDSLMRSTIILGPISSLLEEKTSLKVIRIHTHTYEI